MAGSGLGSTGVTVDTTFGKMPQQTMPPWFWKCARSMNGASDIATYLIIFKTSKALIIAWRSSGHVWGNVGLCGAQLWTAVYKVHGHSLGPSSALVPLDIKRNWVDKSSTLLYEELQHLLSFWGSCWKKPEKCVLALATVHRYFVSNSSFDNVGRFFCSTHADAKRIWGSLVFSLCP